jgi:Fur family ferric uptake transcriptional regulator
MTDLDRFRRFIQEKGLRGTSQREEVLVYLRRASGHRSPEEIHAALRAAGSRVGRATVFRTMKLLEECGLASRVTFADGRPRYELAHGRPHHDHMICTACGRAEEFTSPAIERLQKILARRHGFAVRWHRHELFGLCAACGTLAS